MVAIARYVHKSSKTTNKQKHLSIWLCVSVSIFPYRFLSISVSPSMSSFFFSLKKSVTRKAEPYHNARLVPKKKKKKKNVYYPFKTDRALLIPFCCINVIRFFNDFYRPLPVYIADFHRPILVLSISIDQFLILSISIDQLQFLWTSINHFKFLSIFIDHYLTSLNRFPSINSSFYRFPSINSSFYRFPSINS